MSGYQRVNYYELCRLCTSSEGTKMNIFQEEGRRLQLQTKIQACLPIQVLEEDSLPKIVCHECVKKLENFFEFRETVVSAEGMLESYFTSLRFSEDILKEGKVYVKSPEKDRADRSLTPNNEVLKSIDKVSPPAETQIMNDEQQMQHEQPVVVSNINASNIQIISGVQARVQQYKCAMQIPGSMAAAVVEATTGAHYIYQPLHISAQQPNEAQNQINEQQNPSLQIQVQNQIQNHGQINQQIQPQRQILQQIPQPQNQTQVGQQQNQSQMTQQLQGQQIEKQVQISAPQEFPVKQESQPQVVHQNNNTILKSDPDSKDSGQQIIQKTQSENLKTENGTQSFASVQAPSEMFINLGFKEAPLVAQTIPEDSKDFKDFKSEDSMPRNSMGQMSEFLRIKPAPEPPSLITVNPQVVSQTQNRTTCKECGKLFASINQLNNHACSIQSTLSETSDSSNTKEETQINSSSFSCEVCGKPFKRREHLHQHKKLHTGERPFVCTTCQKAFSRKEHLVRHSVSHTGEKTHECDMCGKSFSRKDNLHKHRKTHGLAGPYICETCGRSFVVKHYYLIHLTTHTAEIGNDVNYPDPLPYKCNLCLKAFPIKQYLTSHKLKHRSRNSNNTSENTVNDHVPQQQQQQAQQQQTQQSNTTNNVNIVINNVANSENLNSNNGQSNNEPTAEMQSVIERNEPANSSFNNQYHNNVQEFQ